MYNGNIVNELLANRKLTKKEFINAMEWTSFSQYRQFVQGNPTAKALERAADYFQVPIDTFFIREHVQQPSVIGSCNTFNNQNSIVITNQLQSAQIETLEKLVEEKEKRIQLLEKLLSTFESSQSAPTP